MTKMEALLQEWLRFLVQKGDKLIARAAAEDSFEPHNVRNTSSSSFPSSSAIDVFSLISKTIENVIGVLGDELLPPSAVLALTDSVLDLVARYIDKLVAAAGVLRCTDVIPPIPPYPLDTTGVGMMFTSGLGLMNIATKGNLKKGKTNAAVSLVTL